MATPETPNQGEAIPFKAETRQLLDILIHSLYTERDVFLRELISNASDALTRMSYVMLTDRDVLDPEAELAIWISTDPEKNQITIRDTGIGMNQAEMVENLGTIAHSGARDFIKAAQEGAANLSDMIGQFGVGFYSAFMVADWIKVTSRSYRPDAQAAVWYSTGGDTYTIEPAEKDTRGTEVLIQLKEDAAEFAQESRLHDIIRKHSDYIPYPIYLGDSQEQANRQSAIWRKQPRGVEQEQYIEFYRQLTLDYDEPLTHLHLAVDAPVQVYALLYVPASAERNVFSPRKQEGLALYARKVLIQEYNKDLLPEYFRFVQGVVDSEDLPLNVSRESIQSNRIMSQLKKLLTAKLIDHLKALGKEDPEKYAAFWKEYGRYIKEGVATDAENHEALLPLLRYHTLQKPAEWVSLDDYVQAMKVEQKKIFYILGDDERSVMNSPHLEVFRRHGFDVLLLADPMDPFTLLRLNTYADFDLADASKEDLKLPETEQPAEEKLPESSVEDLVERFKSQLGERVSNVRTTDRLIESPARLVDTEGSLDPQIQRVYRMINHEFEAPQKVLEINPQHPILKRLSALTAADPLNPLVIEQVYEDTLLIEGLHPDPAGMVQRIQRLMEKALEAQPGEDRSGEETA